MAIAQGCAAIFCVVWNKTSCRRYFRSERVCVCVQHDGRKPEASHIWLSCVKIRKVHRPAQHQIHHSQDRQYHDTNFGSALAIWDRIFSCWTAAPSVKPLIRFGIKEGWHKQSAFALYWLPITENLKRFQDWRHSK